MHSEKDYSFANYRKIKLAHHNPMLIIITFIYIVIQTLTIANQTYGEYGYRTEYIIVGFLMALIGALIMYGFRYRIDYVFYKMFFTRSHKMRLFYAHNQLVGPLLVYLTMYLMGIFGVVLCLFLSRPGKDYFNFKNDVLVLNRNFGEINMMISDLMANPEAINDADAVGFIKYNISMFNMYEIALFGDQAKTISFEQLVENIKE